MAFSFTAGLRECLQTQLAAFPHRAHVASEAELKRAAVAITIVPLRDGDAGAAALLLTRRAATLRGHANQWALPGGRCDSGETAEKAALRETQEEIGLRLSPRDVLGTLDDYPTRSGYLITPVVVWGGARPDIIANPAEVASVHRVPLADLAHAEAVSFVAIAESERRVVRLRILDNFIHAPTAATLYQFGELLCERVTRVADLEQPVFAWR